MRTGPDVNSCAAPTAGQSVLTGSCIREISPELRELSGSERWATAMVARRPFFGEADLLRSSDQVLASLTSDELAEAAGNLGIGEATEAEIREKLAKRTSGGSPRAPRPGHHLTGADGHYSHSIVPGGLLVTSRTTRLTSGTSFVIRFEIFASVSYGIRVQSAVMASSDDTGRNTIGWP